VVLAVVGHVQPGAVLAHVLAAPALVADGLARRRPRLGLAAPAGQRRRQRPICGGAVKGCTQGGGAGGDGPSRGGLRPVNGREGSVDFAVARLAGGPACESQSRQMSTQSSSVQASYLQEPRIQYVQKAGARSLWTF